MIYTRRFSEIGSEDIPSVGGKGASLGEMTSAGIPVPPGFVVTTDAFVDFCNNNQQITDEFVDEVMSAFDELGAEKVATRSSAIAEDSPGASWAGQFESFLNVTRDNLIESIQKCWQSAAAGSVQTYAAQQQTEKSQLAVAVVVQKMVNSEESGVVFTINPVTNNHKEIMIEAIYGLGELLVQGMITPDNYILNKDDLLVVQQHIVAKNRMLIYRDGENVETDVPLDKSSEPCLDAHQLAELGQIVKIIENHYGVPQDIEWAMEAGKLYIVQSRPVTT
jgi:phosphoenolpyruvate synthase/pyruvate phosphate dikinase